MAEKIRDYFSEDDLPTSLREFYQAWRNKINTGAGQLLQERYSHDIQSLVAIIKQGALMGYSHEVFLEIVRLGTIARIIHNGDTFADILQELPPIISPEDIYKAVKAHNDRASGLIPIINEENGLRIFGVHATCRLCKEHIITGSILIDSEGIVVGNSEGVQRFCLNHHEDKRGFGRREVSQHNIFDLELKGENRGWLAVSSAATTGKFSLPRKK